MADTVITPSAYERNDSSAAGWAVAVIVLLGVILFGLFVWPGIVRTSAPAGNASTPGAIDVNVQLPEGVQQGIQGAGAGAGMQQGTQPAGNTNPAPTPAQ